MTRLYLDACVFIYLVEGTPGFQKNVHQLLARFKEGGAMSIITSHLTRLECRVKPLRDGDQKTLALYERLFSQPGIEWLDVGRPVLDRATQLRAEHRFKVPDSIHLASAIEAKASAFITGDRGLQKFKEIEVFLVEAGEDS